jgi:hypothetical protein
MWSIQGKEIIHGRAQAFKKPESFGLPSSSPLSCKTFEQSSMQTVRGTAAALSLHERDLFVSVEYHLTCRAETYICFCTTHILRVVVVKINVLKLRKRKVSCVSSARSPNAGKLIPLNRIIDIDPH